MPEPEPRPAPPDPQAVLLQRARVLERLGGSTWHELAQPLNALTSFISLLQVEGWTADDLGVDPSLVAEAVGAVQRLSRAYTDLGRGADRPAGLRAMIDDSLALAGHQLVDVRVIDEVPSDAPDPDIADGILRLAVASLVTDAIDALGGPRAARGQLRWRLEAEATEAADTREAAEAAGAPSRGPEATIRIVMEDDGRPGAPDDLDLLAALVGAAGGTLRHESPPHGGNRYRLALPAVPTADAVGASPGVPVPPPMTVLVCDDDDLVADLLVRILEAAGITVVRARSGAEALELAAGHRLDAVLADQRMAGMSGQELHQALTEVDPDLGRRFVLMSGDPGDDRLVAYAEGHDLSILGKPFETRALVGRLHALGPR